MNKTLKRLVCLVLVACMLLSVAVALTSCGDKYDVETFTGNYTYNDAVSSVSANWNPHTYQTVDESYPVDYITTGLYSFIFNDEINPVEGKNPYDGYVIIPEMAADFPKDVTTTVKTEHPEFNIPDSATSGYAYTIDLNKKATWQNGEKINADTYIYSMKQLLDPSLMNYRATDYYAGSLCIAGAEFYANQGQTKNISVGTVIANDGLADLAAFLAKYGSAKASVNWYYSFGAVYNPATQEWGAPQVNKIEETTLTIQEMYDLFLDTIVNSWGYDEDTAKSFFTDEVYLDWTYPSNVSFETVGLYKTGEYQITLVLGKSLAGFQLHYNLSGNWIVYEDYYEAGKKKIEGTELYSVDYNTKVENTMSYGPYKMTSYELDKSMTFEKNENWYGYTDGKHIYKDPTDGKVYPMYQTTKIYAQKVSESATRKLMFLKGELMTYGLQADDFDEYRASDFCYATPSETIFFFIFNGYMDAIEEREAASDFDTSKYDLQTMTLTSFRKAVAVTYDKEALCTAISPARSGGYGLIGESYIYDPETGARYRDTDQAKKALCEFYSVDPTKFESLDAAVASITGYDPVKAKELYTQAFNEALAAGYITDANNDGKCDQTINITYAVSEASDFQTKTVNYLTEKMEAVIVGTPFEGKIKFVESAPLGDEWSNKIKAGLADTVLGGWSGSALDPYGVTELYVNPSYQYDANWFNSSDINVTMNVNVAKLGEKAEMKEVELSLKQWSDALNGETVSVTDEAGVKHEYCFGDGIADVETRLDILAMIETQVLSTYNYIPMIQDAGMSLLSKQIYYVIEEYNPIMGRGGLAYLKYNYDDTAWAEYVASQNGELKY